MQMAGAQYRSRNVAWNRAGASSTLQLDLAGAYPEATGVAAWEREIVLERGTGVTVRDRYRLTRPVVRIELALLTPSQVAIEADGSVILTAAPLPDGHHSATGRLQTEIPAAQVRVETVNTGGDSRLSLVWGARLHRIVWTLPRPPREATLVWRILT
jgi:hypothetical protein